jgi:protein-tyrosine phosphatase
VRLEAVHLELERSVTRTSQTDPIRVDFVPQDAHGLRGRLGMSFAPGKCGRGMYATWDRDLRTDLERLRDEYRTDVLVSLLEQFEMTAASIPNLGRAAKRAGLRWISFPITDVSVPADIEATIALVRGLLEELATGRTVVVHCMGGLGRAGTIASCCLAACGVEAERAITIVRSARPGAVQTASQEAFVHRFAEMTPVGSPPSIRQARAVGTRTRNP